MLLSELDMRPLEVPWREEDLPHCVIEVNQRCNLRCFGCYKHKSAVEKSAELVRREIDIMLAARNLSTLSFAGGEPLLHPDLPGLVAYAAAAGVRPVVVTNGTLLDDAMAARLKAAGLAGACIHVDAHQGARPDSPLLPREADYNPLRRRLIRTCERHGLGVGLAVTVYRSSLEELPAVMELALGEPAVRYMLLTGYSPVANPEPGDGPEPARDPEYVGCGHMAALMARRGVRPAMYLPSSHSRARLRWLFYMAVVSLDARGRPSVFHFDGRYRRGLAGVLAMDRRRRGRYAFEESPPPREIGCMLFLCSLLSCRPGAFLAGLGFLARALGRRGLKLFSAVFQESPERLPDGGYEICRFCPDATVRNGRIVPVCLADVLHPVESP